MAIHECICERCGSPFRAVRAKDCSVPRFCSWTCRIGNTSLNCAHCGKTYRRPPSQRSSSRFCSNACFHNAIATPIHVCEICGSPFTSSSLRGRANRFCSRACTGEGQKRDPVPRVLSLVDRSAGHESCWPYDGYRSPTGYGMSTSCGRTLYAHRVAYESAHGPVPKGLRVLHACDNPPCCNPAHLFVGTQADNVHDMDRKGRRKSRRSPLEFAVEEVLRSLGERYTAQAVLDRYPVDFFLPDRVLVIECDGVWWHSRPKQRVRDATKDATLTGLGYRVVRVTEAEIVEDVVMAVARALHG